MAPGGRGHAKSDTSLRTSHSLPTLCHLKVDSYFPHLSKRVIDKTLDKSAIHASFKKFRKPKQHSPIYVHHKREVLQLDIIYMEGRKADNNGFKYILSIIDPWTKFAWIFPMKKISAAGVVENLRQLFSNPDNIPRKITTDKGVGK